VSAARIAGDLRTYCTPTRIAPRKPSPGSELVVLRSRRQVRMASPATIDSTAFSTKTQAVPAPAISAPATMGPMIREAFMPTPLSASACGSWLRGTSSGISAE